MRGPGGVLLGDEALDALGEPRLRILDPGIRPGAGGEEELLVLEALAGRAIGGPVLLVLLELLESFEDHDQRAGAADQPCRRRYAGRHGDRRREDELADLQALEPAL